MRHLTVQQLSASLDGALSGVSLELVTHHLATCRECRDRHSALAKQDETLRRLLAWVPSDHELEDMHIRLEAILDADARGNVPPAHAQVHAAAPAPKPAAPVTAVAPVSVPAPPPAAAPVTKAVAPAPKPVAVAPPAPAPAPVIAPPAPAPAPVIAAPAPAPPPAPKPAPAPRAPRRPLPAWLKRSAAIAACVCALAIAAMIALPPVIRIPVPDVPPLRVPRVEFEHTAASPQHMTAPATHATPIPVVVVAPPETLRAPFVLAPAAAPKPQRAARVAAHTPAQAPTPAPTPAPARKPASESDESAAWPLLCGEVLDDAGQPVAGARISLADLDLSARSDRKGHFCIAAPPGDRTLSVLAQGFATFRTVISLASTGSELHVSLKPAP